MYPDCGRDMNVCFDRYVRDRIEHMKSFSISCLKIGTFTNTYDHVFKKIEQDYGGQFWWSPHSWNVGTLHDRYVYSFALFYKDDSMERAKNLLEFVMPMVPITIPASSPALLEPEMPVKADIVSTGIIDPVDRVQDLSIEDHFQKSGAPSLPTITEETSQEFHETHKDDDLLLL